MLESAVVLLDGATASDTSDVAVTDYVDWLLAALLTRIDDPRANLAGVLAGAIDAVATEHGLRPTASPSSTVAMLRWDSFRVDALVLADSPVVAFLGDGSATDVLYDDRLARLRTAGELRTSGAVAKARNREFWVAEAQPAAAEQALTASWPADDVDAVFVASDGVSCGVDEYGLFDWLGALRLARERGPAAVLDAVRDAELTDPDRRRWPRGKPHDDQALALVEFD